MDPLGLTVHTHKPAGARKDGPGGALTSPSEPSSKKDNDIVLLSVINYKLQPSVLKSLF